MLQGIAGRSVYLVGIGGCGMSGLARMLRGRGAVVSGSEAGPGPFTGGLAAEGFAVSFEQGRGELPEACDLVVASAAIKPDHPEVLEAERRGIPVLSYAEALGRCMEGWTGVALAGTHGKSTTTAMLGAALVDAGLDPTVIVGATCGQLGGAVGSGQRARLSECQIGGSPPPSPSATPPPSGTGEGIGNPGFRMGAERVPVGSLAGRPGLLLCEACEFNRSFHHLRPVVASISAVEADHLDVYGSLDAVVEAFRGFAGLLPPAEEGGRLLIAHEGAHRREVTAGVRCAVETIGFSPGADWVVGYDPGTREVRLEFGERAGSHKVSWTMRLPGEHNAMNAATACALGIMLGADPGELARSLGEFRGVDRRTQYLGERAVPGGSVRVWDDYGHHPTEVEKTLAAIREFEWGPGAERDGGGGRLVCVFQPHQHSRTRFLLEEFANAFAEADVVIVPHIYFVRDSQAEKHKVSAADLVDRLRGRGVRAMHLYPFEAIVEQLENVCRAGDVLVVMGAGPVYEVARGYMGGGGVEAVASRGGAEAQRALR